MKTKGLIKLNIYEDILQRDVLYFNVQIEDIKGKMYSLLVFNNEQNNYCLLKDLLILLFMLKHL